MLDKIISFSLRNRVVVAILALLIVVAGCFVASRMETDVFPDLNAPTVAVMTEAGGMAPEEVAPVSSNLAVAASNSSTVVNLKSPI